MAPPDPPRQRSSRPDSASCDRGWSHARFDRSDGRRSSAASVPDFYRERRLCGRQARHRYPIGRGAHIVHSGFLEEMDRRGIAAMLPADADFQILARLTTTLHTNRDDRADAVDVDRRKGILVENFLVLIDAQEFADIVSGEAERQLREVVGAE